MRFFLLGATGAIGQLLVELALERGHEVTAYVRAPQKISLGHERLRMIRGDVFHAAQLADSMAGIQFQKAAGMA